MEQNREKFQYIVTKIVGLRTKNMQLALEIPFQKFHVGYVVSSFSTNTLSLTWVPSERFSLP